MLYNVDKLIGSDLDANIAKTKKIRNCFIPLAPLGFAMFGAGGALAGTVHLGFIAFALFGFFMLPTSIIVAATLSSKLMFMRQIKETGDTVKSQDKVFIYQLAGGNDAMQLRTVSTVQKLIATGYLEGYRIIGNVMVVAPDVYITEDEAEREYLKIRFGKTDAEYTAEKPFSTPRSDNPDNADATKECYYCHAVLPADAVYCSKCGARLDY